MLMRKNPRQVKSLGPLGEMMSEIIILKNQMDALDVSKSETDVILNQFIELSLLLLKNTRTPSDTIKIITQVKDIRYRLKQMVDTKKSQSDIT